MDPLITGWLAALERRHLADLTTAEVARALRALSSCYVERRDRLAEGGALSSNGKRAAFALFYGPQHFFVVREILAALPDANAAVTDVVDLGCGTGAAGAAWALAANARSIQGMDRHPWAITEAGWTYRELHLHGRAVQANIGRGLNADRRARRDSRGKAILAAYAVNELAPDGRQALLAALLEAHADGAKVLVVEPIARRTTPWWSEWQIAIEGRGGRADEWRFDVELPAMQRGLARAAGLSARELTARSLFLA